MINLTFSGTQAASSLQLYQPWNLALTLMVQDGASANTSILQAAGWKKQVERSELLSLTNTLQNVTHITSSYFPLARP